MRFLLSAIYISSSHGIYSIMMDNDEWCRLATTSNTSSSAVDESAAADDASAIPAAHHQHIIYHNAKFLKQVITSMQKYVILSIKIQLFKN